MGSNKVYVSADYMNPTSDDHADLVNQPAGVLRMQENGDGEHVMSIYINPSDPEEWRIWKGDDILMQVLGPRQ